MSENISVSEERLKLILAEFKLELFERLSRDLAAKANVADVETLKASMSDLNRRMVEADAVRERVLPQFEETKRDVKALKSAAADATAVSRYKKAVYVGIVAAIGAVGGALGYAIQAATG